MQDGGGTTSASALQACPPGERTPRAPRQGTGTAGVDPHTSEAGIGSPPADAALAAERAPGLAVHPYRWAMLAGVWLLYFCFGLVSTAMAPLVKPIGDELGLSHSAMGAVLGAWPLVYIASAIPCGAVLDRFGLRRSLFVGALIISASSALRAMAVDHLSLFLAVALFGLGGPLVSVGAPKLISLWFEGKERGLAMGVYITGPSMGGILALSLTNSVMMPLMGGNWRGVLATYAAIVAAAGSGWLILAARGANRLAAAEPVGQARESQFQVFTGLLRVPAVQVVLVMSVGIFFFNHSLNNWLPEILRWGGMDARTAGFWASVPTAVGIGSALVIPRLAIPARRLAILLALFVAAALATLLIRADAGPVLALGLGLQGVARSCMMTVSVLVLMETRGVGSRHMGAAGGLFFSAAEIGGMLGPLTVGYLSDLTGGFTAALDLLAGVAVVLMLLLWGLRTITARASA